MSHDGGPPPAGVGTPAGGLPPSLAERDRVLDAVKALALGVVVLAHSLAWDVSTGEIRSVLDVRPDVAWVTWSAQILPLFFAAGAVGNLGSWTRNPDAGAFLRRRLVRLATPALIYAGFWTLLLLPLGAFVPEAELAGHFLSQLLWFLGVYAAAVLAVPWTARWVGRPVLTLGTWLAVIVAVDAVRLTVAPGVGWLNLLLVWAWLHQLGYHLPRLRELNRAALVGLATLPLALALGLAVLGPYSSSLVTHAGDPEPSNLSPPTVVVALYGLAQVLVLSALWPWLTRLLARERTWRAIGFVAIRGIGIYLWHIPWVAVVSATAWLAGFPAEPFTAAWWLAHGGGIVVILTMGWLLAGVAARADRTLTGWVTARRSRAQQPQAQQPQAQQPLAQQPRALPALPFAIAVAASLLAMTVTGFGTWWDAVFLGIPASSPLLLAVLAGAWWALSVGQPRPLPAP